ncbi:MAG: GTP-binding protein Era [Candidatus Magnetoglobus multicellularis str. Araruama]|uniref:GTPase Era n=1 Tax=Candidatus Magnetoglobus multicellularis str. Araruama TaxID=890399 RepID=A0A1V1PIR1_9BACT|nr:MAG: GTP-binding protein Era [Candidatus Magnetoglobus multicellularis str. Araruama]
MNKNESTYQSGFIAIIGATNVGKSTLLNQILGQKISITSKKPQTTRNRVSGIYHKPDCQMIFLDTPGIHTAEKLLNRRMVEIALSTVSDVDILLIVVDATRPDETSEKLLFDHLQGHASPVILAINKIDCLQKEALLPIIQSYSSRYNFKTILPISAKTGEQVDRLLHEMKTCLPKGPAYYPDDHITDLSERFIVSEIIREKIFQLTSKEIPYAVAVTIDEFKEKSQGQIIYIHAVIHVERDSQKGIIIGKNGAMLKRIGSRARKEIERMVGVQVMLKLFVKIQKNWASDEKALSLFGYE